MVKLGDSSNPPPKFTTPSPIFTKPSTLLEYMKVTQVKESPEGGGFVCVRLNMPGVNFISVDPNPHESSIRYKGVEQSFTMHGISGSNGGICRTYEGCLCFDAVQFPGLDFTYELINGVLFFRIRCRGPATSANLGVSLKIQQTETDPGKTKEPAFNPLVSQGKDRFFHHGLTKKAFLLAADMPGIGERDSIILHVIGNTIYFAAEERIPASYGESVFKKGRQYDGHFKVNLEELDPYAAQFEIVHGVLWILVPKIVKPLVDLVTFFHDA